MNNESKIEAILFFKNEPVTFSELSKILKISPESVRSSIANLQKEYSSRGVVLVTNGEEISLGTNPALATLVGDMQKEELSRDLGRAGLETLSIVLYKGPVSRREIDYIRGVNSGFTLRTLMIRGLVERTESLEGERSYSYKPTLKLLEHLGLTRLEDLPGYKENFTKLEEFNKSKEQDSHDAS